MKIKITNKGVYAPVKSGKEKLLPVGTVLNLGDIDVLPSMYVNKCIIIGEIVEPDDEENAPAKTAVVNPKK
tara:strand:+ start:7153 stop:7365 length:213 start_codon:yes stop_codon:yes gene_type:complete